MPIKYDLIIIGGGSAGIGACLAAATANPTASILLLEKDAMLGGTSTKGGVHNWEPGIVSGSWHNVLAAHLLKNGSGCVGRTVQFASARQPLAFSACSSDPYTDTLGLTGRSNLAWRRFHFEPAAMSHIMAELIRQKANVTVLKGTEFTKAHVCERRITSIEASDGTDLYQFSAGCYIDASADIALARESGCTCTRGQESRSAYGEPSAPLDKNNSLNAVSLVFRLTAKPSAGLDQIPKPYRCSDLKGWPQANFPFDQPVSFITQYPDGDYCVNMLPTMEGAEYFSLDPTTAYELCKARVYHYFQWLQQEKGMAGYRIKSISPRVGVRESYRLLAAYVLNEIDLRMPFGSQNHFADAIAFADHSIDIHGQAGPDPALKRMLDHPYAIPYHCLLPREIDNLLVACKGAGFSHLAASSCRLSRTMMSIGEAAGLACAQSIAQGIDPARISIAKIQQELFIAEQANEIRQGYPSPQI